MSKIYFLNVDADDQTLIQERFPDAEMITTIPSVEEIAEKCADADVISCTVRVPFSKELIEKLPNLKLLCTRSVGYDHIDLTACKERGITVCHVPDYGSHVIAEHVFALLLSTIRHIPEADKKVEGGDFDYYGLKGMALRGKTIGIIGTGKIGRRAAQIAHGFGMHILAYDVCRVTELADLLSVHYVSLEELLQRSDIITLHVPAMKETHHMLNKEAFDRMKDDVILINTARGELIDSTALLDALNSSKVRYALLDVLEHERNFEENRELIDHPNVVTTPHIGFYADESVQRMYEDCFMSIEQWQHNEEPDHIVHPPTIVCDLEGVQ